MGFNSGFKGLILDNSEEWDRIHLAMDRDEWRAAVNTGMSLGVEISWSNEQLSVSGEALFFVESVCIQMKACNL